MSEALRRATVMLRGPQIVTAGLVNLAHVDSLPYALGERYLDRVPALIVGAGPSLDHDIDRIPAWQALGGYVFAGSNAHGALHKRGIRTDVAVAIEALDVTRHLRGNPRFLVVDQSCHPKIFALAAKRGPRRSAWFFGSDPRNLPHCAELGLQPLHTGGATTTAAVSLALAWGCDPIVLVGCDLSYPCNGDAYATGAGWDGVTVRDGRYFEGREDRDAMHRAEGTAPVPRDRELVPVPAINGGSARAPADYLGQIEWLCKLRRDSELVNATSSGAYLQGWTHEALPETMEWLERLPRRRLRLGDPCPVADTCKSILRTEIDRARSLVESMRTGGPLPEVGSPTVEALAASDTLRLKGLGWGPVERLRATYDVLEAAADRVEALIA